METVPESPAAAAENALERYKSELSRLEGTKKGLEAKISSTRAKVEAAQEIVAAMKAASGPKK